MILLNRLLIISLSILLTSCGGGGGGSSGSNNGTGGSSTSAIYYTISGSVSGLISGQNLIIQNNGSNDTTINSNGSFTFSSPVLPGGSYSASILNQPSNEVCFVSNGSGSNVNSNITSVSILCKPIITLNFDVNNQYQLAGSSGSSTMQFSTGSNKDVWIIPAPSQYSVYSNALSNCPTIPYIGTCTNSFNSQTYSSTQSLISSVNNYVVIKGTGGQYFLIYILSSTRIIDGNTTNGVSFIWFSTDSTTVGTASSSYGTSQQGSNSNGSVTPLNFTNHGTLTINFDLQNKLTLTNSSGSATVNLSTGSTNDSYIYANPSLVTRYNTFSNDCTITGGAPNCQINLTNFTFASNPINITTNNYALVQGTNGQYFLIQFINPQRTIDGDPINGLTLQWFSTSNTTATTSN